MKLEAERSAAVAWSPLLQSPGLLAAGTVAGTMSEDFDYSARIEVFEMNLQGTDDHSDSSSSSSKSLKSLGSAVVSERFHKLAWGSCGVQTGSFSKGLLAGGLANGAVSIWNPQAIIDGEEALVTSTIGHQHGPVQGLEFNPFQPNLLASGGNDCEINIWDLQDARNPNVFNPGNKVANQMESPITCVAWNRKVAHILGSTNNNGVTVIWDLKAKRAVLNFHDPNKKIRCRAMAWNPDEATQLITASEDDSTPVIEMWDLRNTHSPLREFSGHSRGIWAVSWCPVDSDLLLSTGKDNKTLCWNLKNGEVQSEVDHNSSSWNFDVQWSPRIPALLSTCSFEGKIKVVSLQDTRSEEARDTPSFPSHSITSSASSLHAPKWLKRPAGVCFGFGGKLAVFNNGGGKRSVKIFQVVTDPVSADKASQLTQALSKDSESLQSFCEQQAASNSDPQTWKILGAFFHPNQRQELISHLGYNSDSVSQNASEFIKSLNLTSSASSDPSVVEEQEEDIHEEEQLETETPSEFEQMISGDKKNVKKEKKERKHVEKEKELIEKIEIVSGKEDGGAITECIITGKIEEAVNICIATKRWAAAMLLAYYSEEVNIWERAQNSYLKQEKEKFASVIGPIVKKDYRQLIIRSDSNQWKSVLAILCTYTKSDEFSLLASLLGDRLAEEKNVEGATACYVCAGNVEKSSEMWLQSSLDSLEAIQDFVAKVIVLRQATHHSSPLLLPVSQKFTEFASFLASQGKKENAIQCLSFVSSSSSHDPSSLLLDRLHRSQPSSSPSKPAPSLPSSSPSSSLPLKPQPPSFPPVSSSSTPFVHPTAIDGNQSFSRVAPPSNFSTSTVTPPPFLPTPVSNTPFLPNPVSSSSMNNPPSLPSPVKLPTPSSSTPSPYSVNQPIGNAQYLNTSVPKVVPSSISAPFIPPPLTSSSPAPSLLSSTSSSSVYSTPAVVAPKPPVSTSVPLKPTSFVSAPPPQIHTFVPPPAASSVAPSNPLPPPPSSSLPTPAPFTPSSSSFAPPPVASAAPPPKPVEAPKPVQPTSEENQALIQSLTSIFSRVAQSNDPKIQKLEKDVSKRFEPFFDKLKKNEVSSDVVLRSTQLTQAIDSGDAKSTQSILQLITGTHWEELGGALVIGFKRLVDMTK